jgi:hypothetical protein
MSPDSPEHLNVTGHSAVVLFDPASGAIHHIHQVVTMDGGELPSAEELEEDARKYASGAARRHPELDLPAPPTRLEALHIDPSELASRGLFNVDLAARKLVRVSLGLRLRPAPE